MICSFLPQRKHLYFWKAGKWQGKATFSKTNSHFKWGATLVRSSQSFYNLPMLKSYFTFPHSDWQWYFSMKRTSVPVFKDSPPYPDLRWGSAVSFAIQSPGRRERKPGEQCGWWGRGEPRGCWHGAKDLGPRCFSEEFPDFHRNSLLLLLFFFLAAPQGLWDLSCPIRDRTRAHSRESTVS